MMESVVAGSLLNTQCILLSSLSSLIIILFQYYYYLKMTTIRYGRSGIGLLLPDSISHSFPPSFIDGEIWYSFFFLYFINHFFNLLMINN